MSAFVPKPFAEIVAGMVERMRATTDRVTDFNAGAVSRSLLEAAAVELDDYYQSLHLGLLRSIPTAVFVGFGFALLPATAASGVIALTRLPITFGAFTVPAGTRLMSAAGAFYRTSAEVVFGEDTVTASVTAYAEAAGSFGNADPGEVGLASGGAVSATNPVAFSGGVDAETEDQRAERFHDYLESLSRGTVASLEYAATEPALIDPVSGVVTERAQRASGHETAGHVDLYVFNGSFGASDALLAAVQLWIDGSRDEVTGSWVGGYVAAGTRVDVRAMSDLPTAVAIEVSRRPSASAAAVEAAIRGALDRRLRAANGGALIRPIDLINAVISVDGVLGVPTLIAPTAALEVPFSAVRRLGDLTLTWIA